MSSTILHVSQTVLLPPLLASLRMALPDSPAEDSTTEKTPVPDAVDIPQFVLRVVSSVEYLALFALALVPYVGYRAWDAWLLPWTRLSARVQWYCARRYVYERMPLYATIHGLLAYLLLRIFCQVISCVDSWQHWYYTSTAMWVVSRVSDLAGYAIAIPIQSMLSVLLWSSYKGFVGVGSRSSRWHARFAMLTALIALIVLCNAFTGLLFLALTVVALNPTGRITLQTIDLVTFGGGTVAYTFPCVLLTLAISLQGAHVTYLLVASHWRKRAHLVMMAAAAAGAPPAGGGGGGGDDDDNDDARTPRRIRPARRTASAASALVTDRNASRMVKMTVITVAYAVLSTLRPIGGVLAALGTPSYVWVPLFKYIPECIMTLGLVFLLWPFRVGVLARLLPKTEAWQAAAEPLMALRRRSAAGRRDAVAPAANNGSESNSDEEDSIITVVCAEAKGAEIAEPGAGEGSGAAAAADV